MCGALISRPAAIEKGDGHPAPLIYFAFSAIIGCFMLIAALMYPKASEKHGLHGHDDHTETTDHHEHEEIPLSEKLYIVKKILSFWRVSKIFKFIVMVPLTAVNFEVFICYSNEENFEIKTVFESSMCTVVYFGTLIWLALYNSKLTNIRNRHFTGIALLLRFLSSIWQSY